MSNDGFINFVLGLMVGALITAIVALFYVGDNERQVSTNHTEKEFTVTAYCPCEKCCGRFADGVTASGYVIQPGDKFVAAPKEYPFGTLMTIPGYNLFYGKPVMVMVRDRGGSIKGDRLDVFFHIHQEALNWGRKQINVTIYKN